MKKKGFTLIELIGVILIIGIIALITTPIILNIINTTKKEAFKSSAFSLFESAKLYEIKNDFKRISIDGINVTDEKLPLENNNFKKGTIFRNGNDILELLYVTDGTYCAKGIMVDLRIVKGGCYQLDETAPTNLNISIANITSNSFMVIADAEDLESGIMSYQYSIDGINYIKTTDSTYTFKDLNMNNIYNVYLKVTNNNDITSPVMIKEVTTKDIDLPTYFVNTYGWQTSKTVTISYPTRELGFVYSYSIDDGESWVTVESDITANVTFINNGNIIARIYDGTNYKTASSYSVTQIDTTAPSASVAISSKTTNSITVTATGTDTESGVTKYEFSIDNGVYVSNGINATYTFTNVTTGNHSVKVRVTNGSGLTTESSELTVSPNDITTPTYSIDKSGWQVQKIVTITYPERQTGFVYEYSTNAGANWTTVSSGTTQNVTFTSNGNIIARVYDGTNYKSASSYGVSGIDTTAPTGVSVALSSKTTNTITVVSSGTDSESGIIKYEYSIDGGAYVSNGINATYTFTNVTTGNHSVKVRVTNGSGLTTESTVLTVSPNDITVPTYSIDKSGWQVQKVATITYPERQTGFVYSYSIDNGTTWITVFPETIVNVMFTSNGNIIARIYDGTNYKLASSYSVSEIETTAPIITAKGSSYTIIQGASNVISSTYFTTSANGSAPINSTTCIDTSNSNAVVTNTSTLAVGTHVIRCTVTKSTGLSANTQTTIVVNPAYTCSTGTLTYDASKGYICVSNSSSGSSCNSCTYTVSTYGSNCSACGSTCNSCTYQTSEYGSNCSECGSTCNTCSYVESTSASCTGVANPSYCASSDSSSSCVKSGQGCKGVCEGGGYTACGRDTSCSGGWSCSSYSPSYSCPSGYSRSGSTCSKTVTAANCTKCGQSCKSCSYTVSKTGANCNACGSTCNSCTYQTSTYGSNCSECGSTTSYYCSSGWSDYSGSGSGLKCYKAATAQ